MIDNYCTDIIFKIRIKRKICRETEKGPTQVRPKNDKWKYSIELQKLT